MPQFLRYAAILLVLVALPLSFWIIINKNQSKNTSSAFSDTTLQEAILNDNMDYYISPNRCWNERELVCTVIKLNN